MWIIRAMSRIRKPVTAARRVEPRAQPTLAVLEARNLLSFSVPMNYPVGAFPDSVATADLTGNGILDLVVVNEGDQTLSVLLGNGDGTFQNVHTYATGSEPNAIAVGDFTNNGIPDVAVANSGSDTVSVYLGNGDGTFQDPISFATGAVPADLAVGDVNDDGNLDLVVATRGGANSDGVRVFLGNGDGTFQASGTYDTGGARPSRGDGGPEGNWHSRPCRGRFFRRERVAEQRRRHLPGCPALCRRTVPPSHSGRRLDR
jgi:hypothetical protein